MLSRYFWSFYWFFAFKKWQRPFFVSLIRKVLAGKLDQQIVNDKLCMWGIHGTWTFCDGGRAAWYDGYDFLNKYYIIVSLYK